MRGSKPKVLITDNINVQAAAVLRECATVIYEPKLSHEQLLEKIGDVDALMVRSASQVSKDVLMQASRLKIVGRAGVGTDNIDLAEATKTGVVVINSPDGNTIAAAEHTIGMLFALARHIPQGDTALKAGTWARSKLLGIELFGKTLGVVGFGKIGRRVARTCVSLGMKVLVYDPFLSATVAESLGVQAVDMDLIYDTADFITIHAPKTKETLNLFNKETLARCKPGLRIVNCARGGIVNESDLAQAIQSGGIAGAAIDVFDEEPVSKDNPLLNLGEHAEKVVLTPHLGASTEEAQINVAFDVAEQIKAFFEYGYAKNAVNLPLLRPEILEPVKDYMPMAEVLGCFVSQLTDSPVRGVEIVASGQLSAFKTEPLTLAVLKGLLSQGREGVNYVNAPAIAENNSIQVKEILDKQANKSYLNLLEVRVITESDSHAVAGTLTPNVSASVFRIVSVDNYQMTLQATPHILIAQHHDRPGMIAGVAVLLGEAGVNISALQVARQSSGSDTAGGESTMVFNLDNPLPAGLDQKIKQLGGIYSCHSITLSTQA
ncbi:MAG: phosphoglycerate dehydrogenase [Cyanobacteria bacterium P01_H01_bin.74]